VDEPAARFVVGDVERLPFADGDFGLVTAFNSVLYAAAPRRALAEIARVTSMVKRCEKGH
jgi:ubiquinone/menaquinone biosynthesis C-methylase UbiE